MKKPERKLTWKDAKYRARCMAVQLGWSPAKDPEHGTEFFTVSQMLPDVKTHDHALVLEFDGIC